MTASSPPTPITLAQWVPTLLRWYPLRHGVVVGRSQLALQYLNAAPQSLTLFKVSADQVAQGLAHEQLLSPACAGYLLPNTSPWLIASHNGPAIFYQTSLPSENGLMSPHILKPCWPGIQCVSQQELPARTLDAAWQDILTNQASPEPPNWLWVGSLPAAPVLAGATQLVQQADVIAVRVTLQPELEVNAGMQSVEDVLAAQGLVLCGIEPERNPKLGTALFVRDHATAHSRTRQQLLEQGRAKAELHVRLHAETKAKHAEAAAKTAAAQQRDELTRAKAHLQARLEAETHVKQAEAAAKVEAVQQRDELVKAKACLQAKLEVETKAKQMETEAKDQMSKERDTLKKEKEQLEKDKQAAVTKANSLEKQADESNTWRASVEAENKNLLLVQEALKNEITKAQAQIELIKDLMHTKVAHQ